MLYGLIKKAGLGALLAFGLASAASATTITFGNHPGNYTPYTESGYQISHANLDNSGGNCPFSNPACQRLGGSGRSAISSFTLTRSGGGLFDLQNFAFEFSGQGSGTQSLTLSVAGLTDIIFQVGVGGILMNTSYLTSPNPLFAAVESVSFFHTGGGTIRIDNINVQAVPLPASGVLLLAALAGLGLRRRRQFAV